MDVTGCARPPEYCKGGAMAGIDPRGIDPEEVTSEGFVGDGCVTVETYEEYADCCGADVCG